MIYAESCAALIAKMFERDRETFDLNGKISKARSNCSAPPEAAAILTELLRHVGSEIFEAGYVAGAAAGIELAQEIYRSVSVERAK